MAVPDYVASSISKFNVSGTPGSPASIGSHTSGSGTYRAIVFFISTRDSAAFRTVSSGTWNGSALTQATNSRIQTLDDSTSQRLNTEVWYILDPVSNTSGAISLTLSADTTRVTVHAVNIEGPTGPLSFDVAGTAEDDGGTGSTAVSVGITTNGADRLIIAASVNQGNQSITWDSPMTEVSDDPTSGGGFLPRMSVAHADQASSGLATYTGTLAGSDEWNAVAVAFYETPVVGGAFPHRVIGHPYYALIGRVA